jgi:hypothetical protein
MASIVTNTAYGIIDDAWHDAGKLQEGQRPNSEQIARSLLRLNDIINLWQTQGVKLFLQQEITVPLVVGQTLYQIGPNGPALTMPKPPRLLQGFILQVNSEVRRPLVLISRDEWERLSQVTGNNGTINSFMVDKQSYVTNLNVWPPPDNVEVNNSAVFLAQVQASGPVYVTDETGFPQEWRIALRWALAEDICIGQPQLIMQWCTNKAKQYREALEDWDVEDAPTFMNIDSRFYQSGGKFK